MDIFNRDHLKELAQTNKDPCVSLYMPTFRFEAESSQNPIRLKNLLKQARNELSDRGMSKDKIEALLQPARDRLEEPSYWRQQSDGLAAFLTQDGARFYRLPLHFEELAVTGTRFHLKPLFPLIASNNRFYVLALSQNDVRLYQGTHHAISQVEARDIPESLTEALFYDDEEQSLQHHSGGGGTSGQQHSIYHSQGETSDDNRARPQDELHRFFRDVDEGLTDILQDENAPLLLAGVEYYLPILRDVNSYDHLVDDRIVAGNPDHLKPKQLHEKAWEIMKPIFAESQSASIDNYLQLHGGNDGMASASLSEVVPASVFGRIDTAFVPVDEHLWGHYDAEQNAVDVHDDHGPGDDDLLDLVAVHTYLKGGTVHALQRDNMPDGAKLAATFRYPADVTASGA
jgi:hypothetical protein